MDLKNIEFWVKIAVIVNGFAAAAVAYFSFLTYQLNKRLKEEADKHQEEIKDLLQAVALSNLVTPHGDADGNIGQFKKKYTGKTEIFSND